MFFLLCCEEELRVRGGVGVAMETSEVVNASEEVEVWCGGFGLGGCFD